MPERLSAAFVGGERSQHCRCVIGRRLVTDVCVVRPLDECIIGDLINIAGLLNSLTLQVSDRELMVTFN